MIDLNTVYLVLNYRSKVLNVVIPQQIMGENLKYVAISIPRCEIRLNRTEKLENIDSLIQDHELVDLKIFNRQKDADGNVIDEKMILKLLLESKA